MAAAVAGAVVGYMLFESQWVECRERSLTVDDLPEALEGFAILHLSDIHAGQLGLNLWTLSKVVRWAQARQIDLVVLTGDILDGGIGGRLCLYLLGKLRPRFGLFAAPGNHEYGLGKSVFRGGGIWPIPRQDGQVGPVRYLRDECLLLEVQSATIALCGADYVTGGHRLPLQDIPEYAFPVLITHRPPHLEDPLAQRFRLVLAGHTHGGQIRIPTPWGFATLHRQSVRYIDGVHKLGKTTLVISRGVGCTFLPWRLCARPQAELLRLRAPHHERQSSP